jgi:hypothetical protein
MVTGRLTAAKLRLSLILLGLAGAPSCAVEYEPDPAPLCAALRSKLAQCLEQVDCESSPSPAERAFCVRAQQLSGQHPNTPTDEQPCTRGEANLAVDCLPRLSPATGCVCSPSEAAE